MANVNFLAVRLDFLASCAKKIKHLHFKTAKTARRGATKICTLLNFLTSDISL